MYSDYIRAYQLSKVKKKDKGMRHSALSKYNEVQREKITQKSNGDGVQSGKKRNSKDSRKSPRQSLQR